jgi:hypothetical protein
MPAPPREPEAPAHLRRLAQTLRHPDVASLGLTTTPKGEWALLVRLKNGRHAPVAEIERRVRGEPVVYDEAGAPPIARPAYPGRGE